MTVPTAPTEGANMYDELIAVHTIMRRGAELTADAFARHAAGEKMRTKTLLSTANWLVEFVHHHHASEDELFWPVLRELFPAKVAELDGLTAEHEALDAELRRLGAAIHGAGDEAAQAAQAAARVRDLLVAHLGTEEPALAEMFPQVPDAEIVRLRKAIVDGAPRSGPDLVFGLLEDPDRPRGYALMMGAFPPPLRWLRPVLLGRYRARKKALGATA
ncbi:hemerythrin domain-containing protein [Actinomadura sp. DC4]|uniref:hemerythrin domain-containing protein n=1 Tax=Actinomadura sp. DC4 TaxID=3055069 RepID=UPI0025B1071E|nr:hemerythrin domain-containing protein [Actinomadura sp. DC4]MDN3352324.1 hemerythrin domain-containing protein [Actinomadura sp. DC4]